MKNHNVGNYFEESEFACKGEECGCGHSLPEGGMNQDLLLLLNNVRARLGGAIHISSGFRCPIHNANVGGVENSFHTQGVAADCVQDILSVEEFASLVESVMEDMGIEGGVGRYYDDGFVHVDVRGYTARW
jgi:uncharacterized protein YcbK (DUF882 family)